MKNLYLLLVSTILICSSCGKDDPATSGSNEPVEYDCNTFFNQGDYSSLCFVGTDGLVVDVNAITGTTCVVKLGLQQGTVNDFVTVSFFETMVIAGVSGLPSVAEGVFLSIKNDSENTEDISNLGNDAFTSLENSSDFTTRVGLHVRFSNMILTFDTSYENMTGPHCASNHDELIKLAKIVLTNLA